MVICDYLIRGFDSPTLEATITGTAHFFGNLVPCWYFLEEVELVDGFATLYFNPTDDLPEALHKGEEYTISLAPHEDFELIVKDDYDGEREFLFLNCKVDSKGKVYFHYDILKKNIDGVEYAPISRSTTPELLISEGFKLIKSADDVDMKYSSVILEHKMAS